VEHPPLLMPAEWEPHERTWMAWPCSAYTLGETAGSAAQARSAWAAVANAIVQFEPVSMLVDLDHVEHARQWLDPRVKLVPADLDDAWMRDIGPTFVRDTNRALLGVTWVFNGWGAQDWAQWERDAAISDFVSEAAGVTPVPSALTNEGGGVHVNGAGVALLTETVQLDPQRNPNWSREAVAEELRRTLGVSRVIWLPRGLTRDYDEFGGRGHIDTLASFCAADTVLFHEQRNPEHPDFWISAETKRVLRAVGRRDENGKRVLSKKLKVIALPAPTVLEDEHGWVNYSYVNHYVCNGAVIMGTFDDDVDQEARKILRKVYPTRQIVGVDARLLSQLGGGVHSITLQQPKVYAQIRERGKKRRA
jgi:agmatine deiminase